MSDFGLLRLPGSVQDLIRSGALPAVLGRCLGMYAEFPEALADMACVAVEHKLTLRHLRADLGTWGPAGVIGRHLIQEGLAIEIGYRGDPCHKGVCPFGARFGDLCLDPEKHAIRVQDMAGCQESAAPAGGTPGVVERDAEAAEAPLAPRGTANELASVINSMDETSRRGLVVLALLALRSCRTKGWFRASGEFEAESSLGSTDREVLSCLDVLDGRDVMSLAIGSACHDDGALAAGQESCRSVVVEYLLGDGMSSG